MKGRNILALAGLLLMGVSVIGIFTTLRNTEILEEEKTVFHNDITLSLQDFIEESKKSSDESDKDYAYRINLLVNHGIAYYWQDEGLSKYNIRVPFSENYLLFAASYVYPDMFKKHEFTNYQKAMERGVGLCSQHAIILTGLLNNNGIESKIIGLDGHVITTVEVEADIWHVLDPNYGVAIPLAIEQIQESPGVVANYYQKSIESYQEKNNPISLEEMVEVYGKDGNKVYNGGIRGYSGWKKYYFEKMSYLLMWILPLALMFPFVWSKIKQRGKA